MNAVLVSRSNLREAVQADLVVRRPASDTLAFPGPYGLIDLPAPNRWHMVAITAGPGFCGDVKIRLGTGN